MARRFWLICLTMGCCLGAWGNDLRVLRVPATCERVFLPGEYSPEFKIINDGQNPRTVTLRVEMRDRTKYNVNGQAMKNWGEVRGIALKGGESRLVKVRIPLSMYPETMKSAWGPSNWNLSLRRLLSQASLWEHGQKIWTEAPSERHADVQGVVRCGHWTSPLVSVGMMEVLTQRAGEAPRKQGRQHPLAGLEAFVAQRERCESWSAHPRDYAGFSCVWMLESEWEEAGETVRKALNSYAFGGGTLVRYDNRKLTETSILRDEANGLGRTVVLGDLQPLLEVLKQANFLQDKDISQVGRGTLPDTLLGRRLDWTPDELDKACLRRQGMGLEASAVLMLASVLILGPGIYALLRARKRQHLCLVVTPVASLAVSAVIFCVMLGMEGCDYRSRVDSVVVWDGETGRIASHCLVNGFGIRGRDVLTLAAEDRVELLQEVSGGETHEDGSDQMRYQGSFMPDYAPGQVVIRRWGRQAQGLTYSQEKDGRLWLHNDLGIQLTDVALLHKDGNYYVCGTVPPGQTVEMTREAVSRNSRASGNLLDWSVLKQGITVRFEEDVSLNLLVWSGHRGAGAFVARTRNEFGSDGGLGADEQDYRTVLVGRLPLREVAQ